MDTKLAKAETGTATVQRERNRRRPYYTIRENDGGFQVWVEMPGVTRTGVRLAVENEQLIIHGELAAPELPNGKWLHREIPDADYELRLNLNADIDTAAITAKSDNGLLHIALPLAQAALPRQIAVE